MGICYATSKDGFSWDKPDLNLVDFNDNKLNNIIFRGPHGSGIFYDEQAATDDARYKLIFQGPKTSYSSDGLIWAQPTYLESVKASGDEKITGDTHNNFLWAPTVSKYVAFTRTWAETDRIVKGLNPSLITNGQDRFQELKALISKKNGRIPLFALLAQIGSNSLTQCLFFIMLEFIWVFWRCMIRLLIVYGLNLHGAKILLHGKE